MRYLSILLLTILTACGGSGSTTVDIPTVTSHGVSLTTAAPVSRYILQSN